MAGLIKNVDSEISPYDPEKTMSVDWIGARPGSTSTYAATVAQVMPALGDTAAATLGD